ncbi:MAG: tripartite tricarboxylate transporter substrate binding protein [Peptococcales bacterium]|jgi:putative tricarboxylic transport membrane protein
MKIKKVLALLLAVMLIASLVVGCSGTPKEEPKKEEPKEAAKPTYPERAIELTVPFSAGGGSDIFARSIVKVITDNKWVSQPITVVNKPGGSGSIGYAYVAEKKGNPYYIATVSSSFYTAPLLGNSPVSYKDFTPVAGLAMDTLALFVKTDSDIKSIKDVIERAKAKPKSIAVGGTSGTSDDAVMYRVLQDKAGIELKYVPFESGGEVMTALLGGHVDVAWANPGEALTQVEAGQARAIVVASEERIPGFEDVPTLIEEGVDAKLAQFRGVIMPKDAPQEAVDYLEGVLKQLHESSAWQDDYIKTNSITPRFLGQKEFAEAIVELSDMYAEIFEQIGALKK